MRFFMFCAIVGNLLEIGGNLFATKKKEHLRIFDFSKSFYDFNLHKTIILDFSTFLVFFVVSVRNCELFSEFLVISAVQTPDV